MAWSDTARAASIAARNGGAAAHQAGVEEAMTHRLHDAITPDTSHATQAPAWIKYFGLAARRARREGGW